MKAPVMDRAAVEKDAAHKTALARTELVLNQPFFGSLALRLDVQVDWSAPTAWVDGVRLGYNPAFVCSLSQPELLALWIHEIMHCANGHPWRRDSREPRKWNVACDRAINPVIRDCGFRLPKGALMEVDATHAGMSAEWIFARIPDCPPQGGQGAAGLGLGSPQAGDEPGAGDPLGEVRDAPPGADAEGVGEDEWKQAVQQAAEAAKMRGELPAAFDRLIKQALAPMVDWRSVLRRFMQAAAKNDFSWTRPNPRYLNRGLYLPALRSEAMGPILVAIDTSGSIDDVLLNQFAGEIQAIVDEMAPERVFVMYADAKVQHQDVLERGEPFIPAQGKGGGGTDFRPVFKALGELEDAPCCVVYLTDLAGSFPSEAPVEIPVLWASTCDSEAPFGEVVLVQ